MPRKRNTRSAPGSGSIRQRPDGRWEGRITIGRDPETGKTKRRSVYGNTQQEVRKALTKIISDIDNGSYTVHSKMTVSSWCDEWLNTFCKSRLKPLSIASYSSYIENHIKPNLGKMKLEDVRLSHVQKFINTLVELGLSNKTIRTITAVLKEMFHMAVKQSLIHVNPCEHIELPKGKNTEIVPLQGDDIPKFLAAISGDRYENAFAICLFAGLRVGECLGLSWDNVDLSNNRLSVCQQLQKDRINGKTQIFDSTKGGKQRIIHLPDIAIRYLQNEKIRQDNNKSVLGELWSNTNNLVFTEATGEFISYSNFYYHYKRIADRIGRPDTSPHDLRHTAATIAIASGADVKSVQDMLGHASPNITLSVYTHSSDKMKQDTADRIQNYYIGITDNDIQSDKIL